MMLGSTEPNWEYMNVFGDLLSLLKFLYLLDLRSIKSFAFDFGHGRVYATLALIPFTWYFPARKTRSRTLVGFHLASPRRTLLGGKRAAFEVIQQNEDVFLSDTERLQIRDAVVIVETRYDAVLVPCMLPQPVAVRNNGVQECDDGAPQATCRQHQVECRVDSYRSSTLGALQNVRM